VRLCRGFHRPTSDAAEKVWLVCEAPTASIEIFLDGRPLGATTAGEPLWAYELTPLLVARHELTLDVAGSTPDDPLPWREVRLEIRLHSSPTEELD
jgi:hypothetical protein